MSDTTNDTQDPEDFEKTDDGAVQRADEPTPGAPTEEELAADTNLYPSQEELDQPTPHAGDDAGVDENGD